MKTLWWAAECPEQPVLRMVDQTRLPAELVLIDCRGHRDVASAIREMRVRGAPAIGVAAAFGLALAAYASQATDSTRLAEELRAASVELRATRPTAVNLAWALDRVLGVLDRLSADSRLDVDDKPDVESIRRALLAEAQAISDEDEAMCREIGRHGAALIPPGARILTHCNAGALATVSYGTALGVIRAAHEAGKGIHVYVDETRPLLQGARLTAWELTREGIPFTLITDSMAGWLMHRGQIDLVVVGADRIAANGDVANKIGTYSVAVLAREHRLPFYVAAPSSTIDLTLGTGDEIPIEERQAEEVRSFGGRLVAPAEAPVANPAFDVTPSRYIRAIITESGVVREPFGAGLADVVARAGGQRRA